MKQVDKNQMLRDKTPAKFCAEKYIGTIDPPHLVAVECLVVTEDKRWYLLDGNANIKGQLSSIEVMDWLRDQDDISENPPDDMLDWFYYNSFDPENLPRLNKIL